ncbi:hypothetical protein [Pelobacter propionicus]|uniref:hypothetical protein n=1 Tax=Pelobacter propionicus TaxID=29543 RepID=UPI0012ED3AFE|nr:hypothetical protein [Pelobacter propionicus]
MEHLIDETGSCRLDEKNSPGADRAAWSAPHLRRIATRDTAGKSSPGGESGITTGLS